VIVWAVPLILDTGWERYRAVSAAQSQYILRTDSIFAGGEFASRFNRYFNDLFGRSWVRFPIYLFTLLGICALYRNGKRRELLLTAAVFIPYMVFVFVMNGTSNAPLYGTPYIPFFTGLTAYVIISLGDLAFPKASLAGLYAAVLLTFFAALWVWPLVKLRHTEASPPIRAVQYLKERVDPEKDTLCYSAIYYPHLRSAFPRTGRFDLEKCPAPSGKGRIFVLKRMIFSSRATILIDG
jgi:hypothetical protein